MTTPSPTFSFGANVRRIGRPRRWPKRLAWTVGGLLVLALLMTAYYYPRAKAVMTNTRQAQQIAKRLPGHLSQQQFASARQDVTELEAALTEAQKNLHRLGGLRYWPYVGRQYRAADQLLVVGQDGVEAVGSLVDFVQYIFKPFADRGKVSLASISPAEKGLLLAGMSERKDSLTKAQQAVDRAAVTLEAIPDRGLVGPLQRVITPLKQQFPLVKQALDQAIPATDIFPKVLGYPQARTYLFLLENNSELRPGGGFIGTYGLMKVFSGEITSLRTDNVYNLDNAAEKLARIEPPDPLRRYLKANAWYFRDSNWSPDFPSSAKQALFFYQREGGDKNVDGVLAVTPTAISSLLRLVGPIKVSGLEFTADNLIERLQFQVEKGFANAGVAETKRKNIIGAMTKELVDRLMRLPVSSWKDLFLVLSQELNQKQILMYMNDDTLQSVLVAQNWAGALDTTVNQDSLMVVDANLASLKTDLAMVRQYTYTVELKDGQAEATLNIHYRNTGKFDWKTTRYNTYIRVYVPSGATLLDSRGAQLRERSQTPGQVTTSTELGKSVLAAYKSIEPGTESDLFLRYRLPANVADQLKKRRYTLAWQKQPGMRQPTIDLTVRTPTARPVTADGLDNQARLSKDSVRFEGPLDQDRRIVLTYEP